MTRFTTRPEIVGTFGVVSSTHWVASQVTMSVLERGGNAFDAAVAGGFALQVVEPHLNGPAGEVPILSWAEDQRRATARQALLSPEYAQERRAQVDPGRASPSLRPGSPAGLPVRMPDLRACADAARDASRAFGAGEPTFARVPAAQDWADRELFVGDTCHIDVIDRHGNMVAATPSGGWLSSSPAIPSLGFPLGTRLQMTWLDEGLANTLTPGVEPCTTLSPSLAFRDGEPYMAFGTPGGDQQDQWSAAFFVRHAVHGLGLQEAIDAPAFHVKHYASSFWPRPVTTNHLSIESRFPPATLERLTALGHEVHVGEPWSEGRLCACSRSRDRRGRLVLHAAASPRGMQACAVGR